MSDKVTLSVYECSEFHSMGEMHENIEGVVLDKKYHILFHSIYGHQNNTKEQYLEFKNKILNNKN